MSQAYICAVSPRFPENYEIAARAAKWGVEEKHAHRAARVRRGDLVIFIVGGEFRAIHQVTSDVYREDDLLWPEKNGDHFPYRFDIGPPEAQGNLPVGDVAERISFMRGKRWSGTIMGANGVLNPRPTTEDVELIRMSLMAHAVSCGTAAEWQRTTDRLKPTHRLGLSELLDNLAALRNLTRVGETIDPFGGAEQWRRGLMAGMYQDQRRVPTIVVAPYSRPPQEVVLATLFALSATKQNIPGEVRGVIFVPCHEDEIRRLTDGLSNVSSVGYALDVSLTN
jgi:hypothetical protein